MKKISIEEFCTKYCLTEDTTLSCIRMYSNREETEEVWYNLIQPDFSIPLPLIKTKKQTT